MSPNRTISLVRSSPSISRLFTLILLGCRSFPLVHAFACSLVFVHDCRSLFCMSPCSFAPVNMRLVSSLAHSFPLYRTCQSVARSFVYAFASALSHVSVSRAQLMHVFDPGEVVDFPLVLVLVRQSCSFDPVRLSLVCLLLLVCRSFPLISSFTRLVVRSYSFVTAVPSCVSPCQSITCLLDPYSPSVAR